MKRHYTSIIALLATLVLLFSFKGETILANPLTILWIAIPLTIQTVLILPSPTPQRSCSGSATRTPRLRP